MKCFYHQSLDAVGNCKSCGKGLCPSCAVDLGKGLACRGQCEEDAKALIDLIQHNVSTYPKTAKLLESSRSVIDASRGIPFRAAIFNLAIGAVFLGFGLTDLKRFAFLVAGGICFFIYGAVMLLKSKPKD